MTIRKNGDPRTSCPARRRTYGYEWRIPVTYGYTEGLGADVDPERDLLPAIADVLADDPARLEYRREDWPDDDWHCDGARIVDRRSLAHWLTKEQVAQLPTEVSTVIFADLPPYQEPLDFIAGEPERGNFFEEAIRSGALPHFDGIELALHALRLFTLDRFQHARPDILMSEVANPEAAQAWWDYCARLIELLQDMQADYEAVLAGAGPRDGREDVPE